MVTMEAVSTFMLLLQHICYSKRITTETFRIHYSKSSLIHFKLFAVQKIWEILMGKIVNKPIMTSCFQSLESM